MAARLITENASTEEIASLRTTFSKDTTVLCPVGSEGLAWSVVLGAKPLPNYPGGADSAAEFSSQR